MIGKCVRKLNLCGYLIIGFESEKETGGCRMIEVCTVDMRHIYTVLTILRPPTSCPCQLMDV